MTLIRQLIQKAMARAKMEMDNKRMDKERIRITQLEGTHQIIMRMVNRRVKVGAQSHQRALMTER
jgi:TRAP-type mannitol/chloroaromatic compound transport system substrate-binding protein